MVDKTAEELLITVCGIPWGIPQLASELTGELGLRGVLFQWMLRVMRHIDNDSPGGAVVDMQIRGDQHDASQLDIENFQLIVMNGKAIHLPRFNILEQALYGQVATGRDVIFKAGQIQGCF